MTTTVITVIDRAKIDLINAEHHLCERAKGDFVIHAAECGRMLASVKADLPHGQFGTWCDEHFDASPDTAQLYMRIAANPERIPEFTGIADAKRQLAKPKLEQRKATPNDVADFMQKLGNSQRENPPIRLDEARERLRADVPAWTTQQERARERALEQLDEARSRAVAASGLSISAAVEELKLAATLARDASSKLNNLAFEMGG